MTSHKLDNLVKIGQLKAEPGSQSEFDGLLRSAKARLIDSRNEALSVESRFDLAYNASHALALAALRWHGFRSENRYLVFQVLEHTLGIAPEVWRVLAQCHQKRNLAEYEGHLEIDNQLLVDLIKAGALLLKKVLHWALLQGKYFREFYPHPSPPPARGRGLFTKARSARFRARQRSPSVRQGSGLCLLRWIRRRFHWGEVQDTGFGIRAGLT